MGQVMVRSWSCRMYRWLDERGIDFPWWFAMAGVIFCLFFGQLMVRAGFWQWSLVKDPSQGQLLRVLTAVSNPLSFVIGGGLCFCGWQLASHLIFKYMFRARLNRILGKEFAKRMGKGGWPQDILDRRLTDLAQEYRAQMDSRQFDLARESLVTFWRVHNAAWAYGFYVQPRLGNYADR